MSHTPAIEQTHINPHTHATRQLSPLSLDFYPLSNFRLHQFFAPTSLSSNDLSHRFNGWMYSLINQSNKQTSRLTAKGEVRTLRRKEQRMNSLIEKKAASFLPSFLHTHTNSIGAAPVEVDENPLLTKGGCADAAGCSTGTWFSPPNPPIMSASPEVSSVPPD